MRLWRESKGLSLRELAGRVGVSHTSLCAWESGASDPLGENLRRWCKEIGISVALFHAMEPEAK